MQPRRRGNADAAAREGYFAGLGAIGAAGPGAAGAGFPGSAAFGAAASLGRWYIPVSLAGLPMTFMLALKPTYAAVAPGGTSSLSTFSGYRTKL